MVAMVVSNWNDVQWARACAADLARAAGLSDPQRVEIAVGEIGNNCLEHRDGEGTAMLWIGCHRGRLTLRAENPCRHRPSWQTAKPEAIAGFRLGGYGLLLVRTLARHLSTTWHAGRAVVRAEFV